MSKPTDYSKLLTLFGGEPGLKHDHNGRYIKLGRFTLFFCADESLDRFQVATNGGEIRSDCIFHVRKQKESSSDQT
jgi:hypothetical protein